MTTPDHNQPLLYGSMSLNEWLNAMQQATNTEEIRRLVLLIPPAPPGTPPREKSWLDEVLDYLEENPQDELTE